MIAWGRESRNTSSKGYNNKMDNVIEPTVPHLVARYCHDWDIYRYFGNLCRRSYGGKPRPSHNSIYVPPCTNPGKRKLLVARGTNGNILAFRWFKINDRETCCTRPLWKDLQILWNAASYHKMYWPIAVHFVCYVCWWFRCQHWGKRLYSKTRLASNSSCTRFSGSR